MKKIITILLAVVFFTILNLPKAAAQEDATSSAIKEKIKQRLEKTATTSGQTTTSTAPESIYYAWVGILTNNDKGQLTIKTVDGEKLAATSDKTVILQTEKGQARKEISPDKLKIGNNVIVMGNLEKEMLLALRIISSPATQGAPIKKVVFGKVSEVEDEKIILKNGEKNTLVLDKNTVLTVVGVEKPKVVDIQLEDKVYAVVWHKDNKIISTTAAYVIPGKYNPQTTILSSPVASASALASPSASPKVKKSPTPSPEE